MTDLRYDNHPFEASYRVSNLTVGAAPEIDQKRLDFSLRSHELPR